MKKRTPDPTYSAVISELEAYCAKAGVSPSTVTSRALNNARFLQRSNRKGAQLVRDAQALRDYMKNNPPKEKVSHETPRTV